MNISGNTSSEGCRSPVDVITPAPRGAWRELLADDSGATALQTPEYLDAVVKVTRGSDASRLYVLESGRRVLLPLVRRPALPGVTLLAGHPPGFGHGSALATGGLRPEDVRAVVHDLRGQGLSTRIGGGHHTRQQWAAARSMPGVVEESRRVDVVDLSGGWDTLFNTTVRLNVRKNYRKAERLGVHVERDTTGRLVPDFYDLYLAWVDRWIPRSGLPPRMARHVALREERREKFEEVARALGDRCRVFIASHQGRPVAGTITLVHGEHAIAWRAYSIKELSAPVAANSYVQARALLDACESECVYFDLGQSGGSSGILTYKGTWGADPRDVVDLRIEAPTVSRVRGLGQWTKGRVVDGITAARRAG